MHGIDSITKEKMAAQSNNDNMTKFNDPFTQNPPPKEEALIDQPNLSLHVQSFINDPYNQHMMAKFFKHDANRILAKLISQGARLPPNFDRSILDRPP